MKNGRSPGTIGVVAEILKYGKESITHRQTDLMIMGSVRNLQSQLVFSFIKGKMTDPRKYRMLTTTRTLSRIFQKNLEI